MKILIKTNRNQETDFHSEEINNVHFDTVKCEINALSWKTCKGHGFLKVQKSMNHASALLPSSLLSFTSSPLFFSLHFISSYIKCLFITVITQCTFPVFFIGDTAEVFLPPCTP